MPGALDTGMIQVEASSLRLQTNCLLWFLVDVQLVYHMEGLPYFQDWYWIHAHATILS